MYARASNQQGEARIEEGSLDGKIQCFSDIAERTGGSIYVGVVGPVRTGKSTFIKRFMDLMVMPNIADPYVKERTKDELPQSGAGKTITTTEPKFVPDEPVEVAFQDNVKARVRLVDCVGYTVTGAKGYEDDNGPRMVMTPWFDQPIPFQEAAELGTAKVISEHSTIGLVLTTDGSITDIPRTDYEIPEERAIQELRIWANHSLSPSIRLTLRLQRQFSLEKLSARSTA